MNSVSETKKLKCPKCRATVKFDVWIIVDVVERPDLLERMLAGTLHVATCPDGHAIPVDESVLVFSPQRAPQVLFSPGSVFDPRKIQDVIYRRVGLLRTKMMLLGRGTWQDSWLQYGVPAVPREQLPSVLREGLKLVRRSQTDEPKGAAPRPAMGLSEILAEISRLQGSREMKRRAELCRQALELVSQDEQAQLWAELKVALAYSLSQDQEGDHAQNVEGVIEALTDALEVYTRQDFPDRWATAENNLACAYFERSLGNPADNAERAIQCFELALQELDRGKNPAVWCLAHTNAGIRYYEREGGERTENIESAIMHFEQALKGCTRKDLPQVWGRAQDYLGRCYLDRSRTGRPQDIEEAIACFERVLQVYARETQPNEWARANSNLGMAYFNRSNGRRDQNVEQAIEHYERALTVLSRENLPELWKATEDNLTKACSERIRA